MVEKPSQPLPAFGIEDVKGYGRLDQGKEYGGQADGVDHACKGNLARLGENGADVYIVPDGGKKGTDPQPESGIHMNGLDEKGDQGNKDRGKQGLE